MGGSTKIPGLVEEFEDRYVFIYSYRHNLRTPSVIIHNTCIALCSIFITVSLPPISPLSPISLYYLPPFVIIRLIAYLPLRDPAIVEVNVLGLKVDARVTPWKGGAVLSATESVKDLYITAKEWQLYGVRAIRDKAYWDWSESW